MQVSMTTFAKRQEHYIHRTLQSLFASDWGDLGLPVNLMLGSEDDSHVRQYAKHPSIRMIPWDMESTDNVRRNCTLNKIRSLRSDDDGQMVICEDDILFSPNWFSALGAATAELRDEDYILTLSASAPDLDRARYVRGTTLVKRYPRYGRARSASVFLIRPNR